MKARAGAALVVAVVGALVASATSVGAAPTTTSPNRPIDLRDVTVVAPPTGHGVPQTSAASPTATHPLASTYRETEYLLSGKANVYAGHATGPVRVQSSGHPFTTRILVRAPAPGHRFSGSVWVEPLNTTGGGELDAIWDELAPLIEQRGDAWVGITVRAGQQARLHAFDPVRYASIDLADNDYAWDALRDVGALVKVNGAASPLHALPVRHVYLGGYSQSGVDMATFASAFHAVTRLPNGAPIYDAYLVGAHDANLSPLQSGNTLIPKFETAPLTPVDVPLVDFEPQADVEGFAVQIPTALARQSGVAGADQVQTPTFTYTDVGGARVRRKDSNTRTDRYRLVEVPGAPHATGGGSGCDGSSSFPTAAFTRAAAANLARWAEHGIAPRPVPRLQLATLSDVSKAKTDQDGNALGGVRSPFVDVPLSRYEAHAGGGPTCNLVGNETPLSAAVLQQRYGNAAAYMKAFTKDLDATIRAGGLLALDRQSILDAQQQKATTRFAAP